MKPSSADGAVLGIVGLVGLALGGAALAVPFYGFLPLICVCGGFMSTCVVVRMLTAPRTRRK
jgi:hypothetical protein